MAFTTNPDVVSGYKPQRWKMTLYRGMYWPAYSFTITDSLGAPRSLNAPTTVQMMVKNSENDTTAVKTLTVGAGLGFVISGTGNNTATFDCLCDLAPGNYVADIVVTYTGMKPKPYFRVDITVIQNVTR